MHTVLLMPQRIFTEEEVFTANKYFSKAIYTSEEIRQGTGYTMHFIQGLRSAAQFDNVIR